MTQRAHFPPGEAREDWAIMRALSGVIGSPLPYDDLFSLRQAMIADAPVLGRIDEPPASGAPLDVTRLGAEGPLSGMPFRSTIHDFYTTNPVARASRTMAECSAARSGQRAIAAE